MSSTSSSTSSNFSIPSISSSTTPKFDGEDFFTDGEEDNLIEFLKKSLKLTCNNEFLESEIEDLKEFFTLKLKTDEQIELSSAFWLQIFLPITVRTISRVGNEAVLRNENPLISLKIKLKSVQDQNDEKEKSESENERGNEENSTLGRPIYNPVGEYEIPYKILDFKVIGLEAEESKIAKETEKSKIANESKDDSDSKEDKESSKELDKESRNNDNNADNNSEDATFTIIFNRLNEILTDLLSCKNISLLTLIEEFYIKLEEANYPFKEVICRDFYYPVFDSRHWGRRPSQTQSQKQPARSFLSSPASSSDSSDSSSSKKITNNQIFIGVHSNDSSSSFSISYRARALYDFQALMQGELSFKENEILIVLANLGNGWLTARRFGTTTTTNSSSSSSSYNNNYTADDSVTGLIPENYIERLL